MSTHNKEAAERDSLEARKAEMLARAQAVNAGRKPKFCDRMRNPWAGEQNPQRDGFFVRSKRQTGQMNPGLWYEMTDGKGEFWSSNGDTMMFLDHLEAPATEQAPPLPKPVDSLAQADGFGVIGAADVFTAEQVLEHREQYAAWKIAALRSEQAPAGEGASLNDDEAWSRWTVALKAVPADAEGRDYGIAIARALSTPPAVPPKMPDLTPVITWLENGCDPLMAAKELRLYRAALSAAPAAPQPQKEQP